MRERERKGRTGTFSARFPMPVIPSACPAEVCTAMYVYTADGGSHVLLHQPPHPILPPQTQSCSFCFSSVTPTSSSPLPRLLHCALPDSKPHETGASRGLPEQDPHLQPPRPTPPPPQTPSRPCSSLIRTQLGPHHRLQQQQQQHRDLWQRHATFLLRALLPFYLPLLQKICIVFRTESVCV